MSTRFLPREVGSIETGPQIFAGANVSNTNSYFFGQIIESDGPGLLNSVNVANAGTNTLNGIFTYISELEGKPYYNKDNTDNLFIIWFDNVWGIYNFNLDGHPIYWSSENVLYPWQVINWNVVNTIYNPVPIVTKVI